MAQVLFNWGVLAVLLSMEWELHKLRARIREFESRKVWR